MISRSEITLAACGYPGCPHDWPASIGGFHTEKDIWLWIAPLRMFTSNISGKWWYMHVHAPNLYLFIGWKHRSCNPYPCKSPIRLCQEAARSGCRAASGQPRLTESWCLFSISTFDGWYIILTHVYHGPYRWFATFETLIYCMAKMIPFSGVVWGESQNWTRSFWNISQMTRDM